jgi:hypothetical protein
MFFSVAVVRDKQYYLIPIVSIAWVYAISISVNESFQSFSFLSILIGILIASLNFVAYMAGRKVFGQKS